MIALVLRGLVPLKFNGVFPVLDICLMDTSFSFLFDMNVLLQQLCNIDLFSNICFNLFKHLLLLLLLHSDDDDCFALLCA